MSTTTVAAASKRQEAAEQALADVLELFRDPERLPEAIAQTVIARKSGDTPMGAWSLPNQLLCILAGTTDARGYRQWEVAGRHVTRGSRAIRILAPRTRKTTETDEESGEKRERVAVVGFLGIPVFRYEDTEGGPLQVADYRPAVLPPLVDVAKRLGVSVAWAPFTSRYRGAYVHGRDTIVLCSHDESVFFHELAHAAHRRVLAGRGSSLQGGQIASQEVVAEVVGAVLCKLFGLAGHLPHALDYVDHYAGTQGADKAALKALGDVQAVLAVILDESEDAEAQ
jgi:antirestriction protein ArdC